MYFWQYLKIKIPHQFLLKLKPKFLHQIHWEVLTLFQSIKLLFMTKIQMNKRQINQKQIHNHKVTIKLLQLF